MFRRIAGFLAVVLTAGLIQSYSPAYATQCKRGYHWEEASVQKSKDDEKVALGRFEERSGRCVKDDDPFVGGKHQEGDGSSRISGANATISAEQRRFCESNPTRVSEAGVEDLRELMVNGKLYYECPDEVYDMDATSVTFDFDALARSLVVQLSLPDATPIFSPDPNNNEWKMLAVGFPIWLRTEGPDTKSTTASTQGLTFRLSATRTSTTFAMGDGKTITCTAMARYSESVKAGSPSPNCGHAYQQPSGKKDRYTVTGTHHWTVTWSVDSFSGSFPMSYSDSSTIRIGELSALNR